MKYNKIIALMLGALTLSACNDKEDKPDYNSNPGISVSFAQAEMAFKENRGLVTVPMVVSGETNGYVTVEVAVKEYGPEVAMEDVHYLLTSKSYTFDVGATEGGLEMKLVDDKEINEARQFEITIVSAQGASIGEPKSVVITIKDNDDNPYEKMGGAWKMVGGDEREVFIVVADDGEPGYNSYVYIQGLLEPFSGTDPVNIKADYKYDENTGAGTISIIYGQALPDIDLSDYGYGYGTGFLGFFVDSNSFSNEGEAVFSFSEENPDLSLQSDPMGEGEANFVYFVEVSAGYLYTDSAEGVIGFTRL